MEPVTLEAGQRLYLIQYGRLGEDPKCQRETGPSRIVGTELIYLETRGAYYLVRAPDGQQGWTWSARVTSLDPRVTFGVQNRAIEGYLIGGMYEDNSGGSTTELILTSDDGLGELRVEIPTIQTIAIDGKGRAEVTLQGGEKFTGALLRSWLITQSVRVHLDKARSLQLDLRA